jgi:hypothetical protein
VGTVEEVDVGGGGGGRVLVHVESMWTVQLDSGKDCKSGPGGL